MLSATQQSLFHVDNLSSAMLKYSVCDIPSSIAFIQETIRYNNSYTTTIDELNVPVADALAVLDCSEYTIVGKKIIDQSALAKAIKNKSLLSLEVIVKCMALKQLHQISGRAVLKLHKHLPAHRSVMDQAIMRIVHWAIKVRETAHM
jgi:hypothetical protein